MLIFTTSNKPIKNPKIMRTEFNKLVEVMQMFELYQSDDQVGFALNKLSNKITELEKRIECAVRSNQDSLDVVMKFADGFDDREEMTQILSYSQYEKLLRGVHDVDISLDLNDTESIDNNWYGLFESKEIDDKVGKFFKIKSHTHKELEGKTFKILETSVNELGHLVGEIESRPRVWICVNLELDGEFVDEIKDDKVELSSGGIPYRSCYHCSIKEEETVMGQVNGFWLCCDCNDETKEEESVFELDTTKFLPSTFDKVKQVIEILKTIDNGSCIDGETMDYIVKELGFEEYLLRSLVMKSSYKDTKDLLREKFEISI